MKDDVSKLAPLLRGHNSAIRRRKPFVTDGEWGENRPTDTHPAVRQIRAAAADRNLTEPAVKTDPARGVSPRDALMRRNANETRDSLANRATSAVARGVALAVAAAPLADAGWPDPLVPAVSARGKRRPLRVRRGTRGNVGEITHFLIRKGFTTHDTTTTK